MICDMSNDTHGNMGYQLDRLNIIVLTEYKVILGKKRRWKLGNTHVACEMEND